MPLNRTSILRGPAIVQFNGASFYSRDDIAVEVGLETFAVSTSLHGKVDDRVSDRVAKVKFTPSGEWEALGVLWPYATAIIGSSVFGDTDKPLVIHTADGKRIQFSSAAVTGMPSINLSATKQIHGDVEFTCLGKDNESWTATGNLVAVTSVAFADTGFNPADIITQPYLGAWGVTSPWNTIKTKDGWVVEYDLQLEPVMVDEDGTVDYTFGSLAVKASCTPLGITEQNFFDALRLQGAGNARGRSLQANSTDLVISGTGVSITLKSAQLKTGGMAFGPTAERIDKCEWVSTRKFISGVAQPLFVVATS